MGNIQYFENLGPLLPEGCLLSFDSRLGVLSLLRQQGEGEAHPSILAQQQFSASEVCVLLPLLQWYPQYCPHEVTLANYRFQKMDEETIERCRVRLEEAQGVEGAWDNEMRPLRGVAARVRQKLSRLGLDVISILETGYMLLPNGKGPK